MPTSDLLLENPAAPPATSSQEPSRSFLAIPADAPRWLIPAGARSLDALLASWRPYRLSSRLKWRAVRLAHQLGALERLPAVQKLRWDNADDVDWRALGWAEESRPLPLVYIGTPGPTRKAVIHLIDRKSGICHAIAKLPLCEGAKQAIIREADALSLLGEERYPCAPRLLGVDRERGISTQQFMTGRSAGRKWLPEWADLLRSLLLPDEHTTIYHHLAIGLERTISCQADSHTAQPSASAELQLQDLLNAALDQLSDTHLLPACWVHGDFAPWNIRTNRHHQPALIDWEDAEREGLPLQDAFHFFHMQDFLFGRSPTTHACDAERFAKSLGIPAQQCRKLEIAYLFHAHGSCNAQPHQMRAAFLLKTLAVTLHKDNCSTSYAAPHRRLHLVSSHPASTRRLRAKLFNRLIADLNQSRIPYCILSGYQNDGSDDSSDVDIMFLPADMHRVPHLLAQTARSAGARLVQSIQHETSACYHILALEDGKHIAHLDVDCYGDYRRDGRLWLSAEKVIARRRQYRDFSIPGIADEFIYYLIKKVLKQSINLEQLTHLQELACRNPMGCRARIVKFWPAETASRLLCAIFELRLEWLQAQLPNFLTELQQKPSRENVREGALQWLRQSIRIVRRISLPTGFSVVISGGNPGQRSEIADRLVCRLAPAFRHSRKMSSPAKLAGTFAHILQTWTGPVRSTLLVRVSGDRAPEFLPRNRWREWRLALLNLLTRADMRVVLETPRRDREAKAIRRHRDVLYLDDTRSPDEIVRIVSGTALERLAARTEKRLHLPRSIPPCIVERGAKAVQLGSVGLD